MRNLQSKNVLNFDGRRVLDDDGKQEIDGVTSMGGSTEVPVGLIAERLFDALPMA
ncbi:hypothetical protein [Paraburkholderia ribeironis]|nr:hypothetical protein [Paraburkholderia ribeironis]